MNAFRKTAAAAALLCVASAWAQQPAPLPDEPKPLTAEERAEWRALDVNNDNRLSRDEVAKRKKVSANFDKIDRNKDGLLTEDELRQWYHASGTLAGMKSETRERWDKRDANDDGYITRDELAGKARALKNFDKWDADKDGRISKDEARAFRDHRLNPNKNPKPVQ